MVLSDEDDSEIDVRSVSGTGYNFMVSGFDPPKGSRKCDTNPGDPGCTSCPFTPSDPGCPLGGETAQSAIVARMPRSKRGTVELPL